MKNAVVLIDAAPFKQYYNQHYGIELGTKKKIAAGALDAEAKEKEEEKKHSSHVNRKLKARSKGHKLDQGVSLHHHMTNGTISAYPLLKHSPQAATGGRWTWAYRLLFSVLDRCLAIDPEIHARSFWSIILAGVEMR